LVQALIESWLPVAGWEYLYHISNMGRIKCLDRVVLRSDGKKMRFKQVLTFGTKNEAGYLYFTFKSNNGRRERKFVHRLVAEHFIPNPNKFPVVNHLDGSKGNNVFFNLSWNDASGNQKHAILNGLFKPHTQKLSLEVAKQIRAESQSGAIGTVLAKKYNVNRVTISRILNNRSWNY
jgi:hypothetical protein